jgi:cell division protein FtsI (penicillin-binding protein 3)
MKKLKAETEIQTHSNYWTKVRKSAWSQLLIIWCVPILLGILNLIFANRALHLPALITQSWIGLVILIGMAYACGMHHLRSVKPQNFFRQFEIHRTQQAWFLWILVLVWSFAWLVAWVTLPVGHLLKLLLPPVFYALAFISIGSADAHAKLLRKVLFVGFVGLVSLFVWNLATHTFMFDRFVSDFTGPLNMSGRHYQYVQVLHGWRGVQLWGEVGNLRTGFRHDVQGLELLRFIRAYGALPGALVCAAMIASWVALWRWLRGVHITESVAETFSADKQRFGLALLAILGVALGLYVLFNFGISRLSFGVGVLALSWANLAVNLPWIMVVVALGWVMSQAYRFGGTKEQVGTGKSKWISMIGYGLLLCLTAFVLLLWSEYRRHSHEAELAASLGRLSGYSTREVIRNAEGKTIAENKLAYDVWVTPYEFWAPSLQNPKQAAQANINSSALNDTQREARLLEALTAWPQTQAIVKFRLAEWRKSKDDQSILAWAVPPEIAEKLKAQNIPGIKLKPRTTRHYPDGALYGNVLGFTGLSDPKQALEGMELAANRHLHTFSNQPDAKEADGITTTLVDNIQQTARDTLQTGVKAHGASGGAIVVVDVEKNEIAAMVSAPDFDPNEMSSYRNPYQPDRIINRAINKDFPIGHLISPLVVAHQLESGQTTLNTRVALGDGTLKVGDVVVKDAYRHDVLTVEEIIAKSSNVGLAKLMMQMPLPELERIHDTLGFSQPLRIYGLTGGLASETAPFSKWTPEMQAMPGTWIDANLMQVLRAYMPIANGGYLATPYITKTSLKVNTPQVLKAATAAAIRQAMVQAVSITGTSPKAQIMGVEVAGKTSTMIGWNKSSEPVSKNLLRDTSVFVGMLPAAKPKWLVGVFLEFPSGKIKFAGDTAAPMFAKLADKALVFPSDRVLSPVTISSDKDKSVEIK